MSVSLRHMASNAYCASLIIVTWKRPVESHKFQQLCLAVSTAAVAQRELHSAFCQNIIQSWCVQTEPANNEANLLCGITVWYCDDSFNKSTNISVHIQLLCVSSTTMQANLTVTTQLTPPPLHPGSTWGVKCSHAECESRFTLRFSL